MNYIAQYVFEVVSGDTTTEESEDEDSMAVVEQDPPKNQEDVVPSRILEETVGVKTVAESVPGPSFRPKPSAEWLREPKKTSKTQVVEAPKPGPSSRQMSVAQRLREPTKRSTEKYSSANSKYNLKLQVTNKL